MKNLIDLVNKSFNASDELNGKLTNVNEIKMNFISSLNDAQCIEFLKLCAEIEELQEVKLKEYIHQTYKICKEVFKLRYPDLIL